MDNGGSNSGDSFKVEHETDTVDVLNVHKAGAREVVTVTSLEKKDKIKCIVIIIVYSSIAIDKRNNKTC